MTRKKYRQMILDAAGTVLGYFGFDRTVYGTNPKNNRKKMKWYEELHQERIKDIEAEMMSEKQESIPLIKLYLLQGLAQPNSYIIELQKLAPCIRAY